MRRLKESGAPPPWTQDRVIGSERFTCVFRPDDPGTKVVVQQIRPCASAEDAVVTAVACLLTNHRKTVAAIGPLRAADPQPARIEAEIHRHGFGGAYQIPTFGAEPGGKPAAVAAKVAEIAAAVRANPAAIRGGSEALYRFLLGFSYIGPFLAYQICVDVGYYDKALYDEDTHVVAGPGAIKGLGWLFPDVASWTPPLCEAAMRYLLDTAPPELLAAIGPRPWNLMSVENCLCEGDKYLRCTHRTGASKRHYP